MGQDDGCDTFGGRIDRYEGGVRPSGLLFPVSPAADQIHDDLAILDDRKPSPKLFAVSEILLEHAANGFELRFGMA